MKIDESVTKYMATKLIKFTPETDILLAIKSILKNNISGAPVLSRGGELVGILSEKDCLKLILEGLYDNLPGRKGTVADYMSTTVKTIGADKTVVDAAYIFMHSNYRRLPVVDKGKLVGQISRRDILRAIQKVGPVINHSPSSWGNRAPMVHPSKKNFYSKNA
ncbi:MAG TPA: CBS domain-containing protein [Saprospiraceae bacterium]|nr:CBS domain-containing protein [Saprospiraceae bacterium]